MAGMPVGDAADMDGGGLGSGTTCESVTDGIKEREFLTRRSGKQTGEAKAPGSWELAEG
jgi:hypothetical protein